MLASPLCEDLEGLLQQRYAIFRAALLGMTPRLSIRRVHQARVAARSLRSILATLTPALDRSLAARVRRGLRGAARQLGAVREADVRRSLLLNLAGQGALPPAELRALERRLQADRRIARSRLLAYATSVPFRERLQRLDGLFTAPALVAAGRDPEALLRHGLRRRWKQLRRALDRADPDPGELHELRLCIKHARYATEALLPLLGGEPATVAGPLRQLQDCLGDHQDAVDALRWLGDLDEPGRSQLLSALRPPLRRVMRRRRRELLRLRGRIDLSFRGELR